MESVSIAKKFLQLVDPEVKIAGMPDMEICKSGIPRRSITGAIPSDAIGERKDLHVQRNPPRIPMLRNARSEKEKKKARRKLDDANSSVE